MQLQESTFMSSHCTPQNDPTRKGKSAKMSQYTVLMKQFVALNFHRCFCFLTVGLNSQTVWVKWMKKTYQIMSVLWFISYSRRIKEVHLAVKSPVGFSMPCFVKTNRKAEIIEMLCCFYSKYWLHELNVSINLTAEMRFLARTSLLH